ncbi:MAG: hypothetical protein IJ113_02380 [Eggerthellaceae bacterium]|nr:hypothetical protein [Eggerthellaceae bacterium]MBQ9147802.1 hypothetical protein [Rikenellaceae bacterium]
MDAFATVDQYIARFGEVSDEDLLQECLEDATAAIQAALEGAGVDYSKPTKEFADKLMRVCRSVANRVMPRDTDLPIGTTQMSETAGPYSQSYSIATAYDTPKLIPSELKMLGIGGGRIGWARLGGYDDCRH